VEPEAFGGAVTRARLHQTRQSCAQDITFILN